MKIGPFGHYGNRNPGDHAIMLHTRRPHPEAAIVGLSIALADTAARATAPRLLFAPTEAKNRKYGKAFDNRYLRILGLLTQ